MLLDDIIALATDNKQSIAVLLRKCLILAHQLKNERLKKWATLELNGYSSDHTLPDYRVTSAQAKGHFSGPFGSGWNNYPIPPAVLEKEHRKFALEVHLNQAISAYEDLVNAHQPEGMIIVQWPTNLVLYYQRKIMSDGMTLTSAYQEVPKSGVIELLDTVRNSVLEMALEIRSEVGENDEDLKQITPADSEKVDQTIVNIIGGGNVYFASGQSSLTANTIQQQNISVGDWKHLEKVLRNVGLGETEVHELSDAVKQDQQKIGERVTGWITRNASKVISGGVNIGATVGQSLLEAYLKQYFGLP